MEKKKIYDHRRWITISEYYNVENGEKITKAEFEREFYKTGIKHKNITENEKYRITTYWYECRRNRQQKLKL